MDTPDVGADTAYLESAIPTITTEKARQDELARSQEETHKAGAEHEKAMQLLAAARAKNSAHKPRNWPRKWNVARYPQST